MSSPHGFLALSVLRSLRRGILPRIDGARFVGSEIWWENPCPPRRGGSRCGALPEPRSSPPPGELAPGCTSMAGGHGPSIPQASCTSSMPAISAVHRLVAGAEPVPLTPVGPAHGGLRVQGGRLLAVRGRSVDRTAYPRDRRDPDRRFPPRKTRPGVRVIAEGDGIFAHPALSPDGCRVAWISWNRGRMPWRPRTCRSRRATAATCTRSPLERRCSPSGSARRS